MKKTNQIKIKMLAVLLFSTLLCAGTAQFTISPMFKAVNFWMPGENENGLPDLDQDHGGHFQKYITQLKNLGVSHVRIGGKAYDQGNMWSQSDLEKIINWLRSNGFEVIVQVPIDPTLTISQNAARTASYVTWMNVDRNLQVELWEIGNEPDTYTASPTFTAANGDYTTDAMIAAYTRSCSAAMKAVSNQQFIKIIGPSLNAYHPSSFQAFLTPTNPAFIGGMSSAGFPYVDYISFNQYPFDKAKYTGGSPVTRQEVIDYLRTPNRMAQDLDDLKTLILTASGSRSGYPLGVMITEANIAFEQDNTDASTKGLSGLGPGSFIGGQFWAEMMAIGMEKGIASLMHWSVVEGTSGDSYLTDIGLIGKEITGTNTASPNLRPAYHHFKVMNEQFKGTFYPSSAIQYGNGKVKAWAAQSGDRIAVMVQNQNTGSSTPFHVRLDNNTSAKGSGTVDVLFNIPALNASAQYTSVANLDPESTVLLIFNCKGAFAWRYDYSLADAIASPTAAFDLTETKSPSPMIAGSISFGPNTHTLIQYGQSTIIDILPTSYSYSWSGPCGNVPVSSTGTQATLTACKQGTSSIYSFTATDANGCKYSEEIAITASGIIVGDPYIHLSSVLPSTCGASNGAAAIDCGTNCAGATYSWDNATPVSASSISGLAPGMHTVTMYYSAGTENFTFLVPITGTQPAVFAGHDFSAGRLCKVKLQASPLLQNHAYLWYSGNSTVPFTTTHIAYATHWSGEKFRVKVTDANGCTNEDEVYVGRHGFSCLPDDWAIMLPCDPQFNSTYRSASTISTETLTESQTIEKNMYLDKILVVPEGVTLTVQNCIVAFSPSAHIVLNPGGGLVLETTYFVPCGVGFYPYVTTTGGGTNSTLIVKNSAFEGRDVAFELNKDGDGVFDANTFSRCSTCIDMDGYNDFSFTNNTFYEVGTAIRSKALSGTIHAEIQSNNFILTSTGINITEGDHSMLAIACNTLDYSEYGIKSEGIMQDFGDATTSSGNYFISNSSNVNHQLHHTGNPIRYFCGPNHPFSLSGAEGCRVTTTVSLHDPDCPEPVNYREAPQKKEIPVLATLLKAYPNPTPDNINIICVLPAENATGTLSLFEIGSGKVLQQVDVRKGSQELTFDLSKYESAVFGALLQTNSGERHYIKILKAY